MHHKIATIASLLAAALAWALAADAVQAHEEREVAGYRLVVGMIDEPVSVGQKSGLELVVTRGDQRIEGLERTLHAEVILGDDRRALELSPRFGEPGAYESVFSPTAPGAYAFHLSGTVEGTAVDETFTAGPEGFGEVEEAAAGQFPIRLIPPTELQAEAQRGAAAADQVGLALGLAGAALLVSLAALGLTLARRRTR
jgi:hypothetical protein